MSRPVYSKLLIAGYSSTPSEQFKNTVPAGVIWVVRCIDVFNGGSGAFDIQANDTHGDPFFVPFATGVENGPKTYHWEGRQVLPSGTPIYVNTADGPYSFSVSGYELTLP